MDEKSRRRIAFIAAAKEGLAGNSIYSYDTGKFVFLDNNGSGSYYDHDSNTFFEDEYDFDSGNFWEVNGTSGKYDGYHFGFSQFFECSVNGKSIELYDFGSGSFHNYELS